MIGNPSPNLYNVFFIYLNNISLKVSMALFIIFVFFLESRRVIIAVLSKRINNAVLLSLVMAFQKLYPWPNLLIDFTTLRCWVLFPSAAAAKSFQSCLTLCDPVDGSPPGFPVPGILQARTPEWVAISFSNAWKWKVKMKSLSLVRLLATPWTAAYQAPPSMGFSRQEYWSGVPLPSPYFHLI